MNARVRVWCLRHAESENVTAGLAGALPTASLTQRGHHQASAAARALAGEPITGVFAVRRCEHGRPQTPWQLGPP